MKLYILRHGQAEARAASDAERPLTTRGEREVARMIEGVRAELEGLTQLWASPYRRACQSAAIAAEILDLSDTLETELLVPEADPEKLFAQLQVCEAEAVLLVSHQPLVGRLLDRLCGTEAGYHTMGTASLARVDTELVAEGLGVLTWLRHAHD
ncbi:phosphohistidine phosphatase SixA [Marinimicrobium alkaliphilum]|uniref:phosphohistidine phosphatase SixA n=1 Tax=Marinimicrobium alkaliphilum TaxID=2202654 RepID=UPI000DB9E257|nr:phosphohistidine phosphatase SixA [Marinimicrobium alkaliphilum]